MTPIVKVKMVIADMLEKGLVESAYHKNVLMQFIKEPDESHLLSNEDDGEQAIMDEDEMKLEIYKICRSNWSYSAARKELSKFKVTRK